MLIDNHGREINYLRLAVTDRCNLRCFYCMPEEGIDFVPRADLLSWEEMLRVATIFAKVGVSKIRITGGEPFLRKGLMEFLKALSNISGIEKISITTNGTLLNGKIAALKSLGIDAINLSLDSVDAERFFKITRRDDFAKVMHAMQEMLDHDMQVKLNMVVMEGRNIEDIIPMLELTRHQAVSVRFIEEMPFNGTAGQGNESYWSHVRILEHIKAYFPEVYKLQDPPYSTSSNYKISAFKGDFGIIAAYSRTFCGTCNRLRLTPQGLMKTCLYDHGVFNIRDLMRAGATDSEVLDALKSALQHRAKDGYEAEKNRFANLPVSESMATIGG